MVGATVALSFAGVGRLNLPWWAFLSFWLSPLAAGMAVDLRTRGRVHPVYVWSVGIFSLAFVRIFFAQSEGWLRIGRVLMRPFV